MPIEARRACNHADGSANISASLHGRVLFSLHREEERGRKEEREVPVAIGQPRTRLLHMLSISCSNSTETDGNEETFTAETTSTIPVHSARTFFIRFAHLLRTRDSDFK